MDNKHGNPIKEIVISISFDSTLDLAKLDQFCQVEEIQRDFPNKARGFDAALTVGDKPRSEFRHTGYILRSNNVNENVLNLMLGKLSYHILDRYEDFGEILDKLDLYWNIFQQTLGKFNISLVSVRYINLIDFEADEKLEDYLRISVKAPFAAVQSQLVNFIIYPKANDKSIKANVTIANNQDKNLILDTLIEREIPKKTVKNVSDLFFELRPVKNTIFEELITERTKERFEI